MPQDTTRKPYVTIRIPRQLAVEVWDAVQNAADNAHGKDGLEREYRLLQCLARQIWKRTEGFERRRK